MKFEIKKEFWVGQDVREETSRNDMAAKDVNFIYVSRHDTMLVMTYHYVGHDMTPDQRKTLIFGLAPYLKEVRD